jgi:hypothetical protein
MSDLPLPAFMPGWQTALVAASLALSAIAALVALAALSRERRMSRQYRAFMSGADGADLAAALDRLASRAADAERRLEATEARGQAMEQRLLQAVQHVGVLRYSAYNEAGGDQSFVVAMLDDKSDGVVFSSLVSRAGTRVFAKPVAGGRSSYPLTTEEEQVIEQTRRGQVG